MTALPDPPSYLAFDLGASSSRAILGTLRDGRLHLDELHRFATPVLEDGPHLFWDVDVLWRELQEGLCLARAAAPSLRSLSVDSWGVDYVSLGADGVPLRRPHCYRDPRTEGVMAQAFERLPPEAIYAITGIQFLPFNTLFQLLADQAEDADALRRVHHHLPIADYFNYRFSGTAAVEVSMASTTQLMDVHRRQWAAPLMQAFGLDAAQWPAIVPSGTRLGAVRGAPEVAVLATCSHDTGCAVAAVPAPGAAVDWAYISSGTWSLVGVERRTPLLTDAVRAAGFTHEAGVDGTLRFLKNLSGLWTLQECVREWQAHAPVGWDALVAEARAAGPARHRLPLDDPRFLARGGMEARLRAYMQAQGWPFPATRGGLARLLLESVAEGYRQALADVQRVTGTRLRTVHLIGGGAQNTLLCQLTADACGLPVVAGPAEATALGNLLLQARTLGDLPEGDTLRRVAARSCAPAVYPPTTPQS